MTATAAVSCAPLWHERLQGRRGRGSQHEERRTLQEVMVSALTPASQRCPGAGGIGGRRAITAQTRAVSVAVRALSHTLEIFGTCAGCTGRG
jgi:hypothetical protein